MRCREALRALGDRELGELVTAREARLAAHLSRCPDCAAADRVERRLIEDLTLLRGEAPFEIDVTDRVRVALARCGPSRAAEVSARQLAAAAAVAATVALGAVGWLAPSLPQAAGWLRDSSRLLPALRHLGSQLAGVVQVLAEAAWKALGGMADALTPLVALAESLQPLALVALAAGASMMLLTILLVVGRDLRSPALIREGPR